MKKLLASVFFLALLVPALAGTTNFFTTQNGGVDFPMTPTTIDGMTIGATTPAPGNFTTLTSTSAPSGAGNTANFASPPPLGATAPNTVVGSSLKSDSGTKTAAATAGAATLNKTAGVITSEALTTAAGATYTLDITNSTAATADQVFASVQYGTATAGSPAVTTVSTATAGHVIIVVQNIHASAALDGTIKVSYLVMKN